jgi:hypothetical protein
MTRGSFFPLAVALVVVGSPGSARAFEREWHLGGGLGVTAYPHNYSAGPALGLNAAYGVSDVFDVKLELLGSLNGYQENAQSPREHAEPFSAAAGLSYKLDVLQWIPYGALLVGYQHVAGRLPVGEPFRRDDALVALVLGLDYAATRSFGLGASIRSDLRVSSLGQGQSFTPMLRAEYHWGF